MAEMRMKTAVELRELAKSEADAFAGTGYDEPKRQQYWKSFEAHVNEKATKMVNGLLGMLVKAYVKQAAPFLVSTLIAEFYENTKIEFDERGPYIRLDAPERKAPAP